MMALTAAVLEREDFRVLQARTADEARAALAAAEVDVIVSDVSMPGGRGEVPVYGADARGLFPGLVYMSGDTARASVHRQPGTERALFLSKPFTAEALVDAVRSAPAGS